MNPRKRKKETIILVCLLVTALLSAYVILTRIENEKASYVIEKANSYIHMLNGTTGKLVWYSQSASAIINACVGNLTNGGKISTKGEGQTWTIDSRIDIDNDDITWISDWSLTLKAKDGLNDDVIKVTANNVVLDGLHIHGNANNQVSGDYAGIRFASVNNGVVENCLIHECMRFGTTLTNSNNCTYSKNTIHNIHDTVGAKGYGIFFWGDSVGDARYNRAINNIIYDIELDGIGLHQQEFFEVIGNTVYDVDTYGIPMADSHRGVINNNQVSNCSRGIVQVAPASNHNTFLGNEIECNENTYGIYLVGDYNNISGNNIYNYNYQGIMCSGNENSFTGNTLVGVTNAYGFYVTGNLNSISGGSITGGSKPAININGGNDNTISGLTIVDTATYHSSAIDLDNADRTLVSNNTIDGYGGASYYAIDIDADCDDTQIFGNSFVDTFPSGIINDLGTNTTVGVNEARAHWLDSNKWV